MPNQYCQAVFHSWKVFELQLLLIVLYNEQDLLANSKYFLENKL